MRKLRFEQALCSGLLAVVLGIASAKAEDARGAAAARSIDWSSSYRNAADEAVRTGKPMLVRITATWCAPCQQMKQLTFADSRVVELTTSSFVPLLIDADANPDLVTSFRVEAFPTTLVVAPDLTILKRLKGFQSAESLVASLSQFGKPQGSDSSDTVSALDVANEVKFGFDGYCLVSLLEETTVRKGSAEFVAEYRGQTVCFQSEESRQRFLAEPEKYWPVANGQCLVSSREGKSPGPGDPRMAVTWRGRIWMFSDRERQKRFIQSPSYYASEM
jgi:YHS domain-containing protein